MTPTGQPAATPDRSQKIADLCDSWVSAATAGGGLQLGGSTEQYRLRNNGLQPHDFRYPELRAACVGLAKVLLHPGLNTIIDFDHQSLWAWCAEILVGPKGTLFNAGERELHRLMGLACRASLAGVSRPDRQGFEESRARYQMMEPNARELVTHSHEVLAYLAFPVLEGTLRRMGKGYVDYSGNVLAPFQGRTRSYQVGERCSSLGDLLQMLYSLIAGPELKKDLDDFRQHIARLAPGVDAFDTIFQWRNSSLHGSTTHPTIGGTIFTMALLIGLDHVKGDYDAIRGAALQHVAWEMQTAGASGFRSPWSYYPPWI